MAIETVDGFNIVHADADKIELGYVTEFDSFDCTISMSDEYADNSFVLSMPIAIWEAHQILKGHYIYIPGTEYGGRVGRVRSVANEMVEIEGYTARGWMSKWLVHPATGDDYFVVPDTEANAAIALIAQGRLTDYFSVSSENSGFIISGSFRHQTVHSAINARLEAVGARMEIQWLDAVANISVVGVSDLSKAIDLSQDYGAKLTADADESQGYNCIVALGRGELAEREEVILYLWSDGTITNYKSTALFPTSLADVREYKYENSGTESISELTQEAINKLKEVGDKSAISIDLSNVSIELQLGDIVGARDRVTGLAFKDSIYSKILRISREGTTLNYTVKGAVT